MTTDAPAQGPIPLRPMNLGDLLDGAVRLLVANWRPLLLAVGVVVVPFQLLSVFLQRDQLPPSLFELFTDPTALERLAQESALPSATEQVASFVGLIYSLLLPVLFGAVCVIVAWSYLGHPDDWRAALRVAARRFGSLLGATILVVLVAALPLLPAFIALGAAFVTNSGGLAGLSLLLLLAGIIGAIILGSLFAATTPAVVIERLGPVAAMRRSWRLRRPRLGATVGAVFVTWLFATVVSFILSAVASLIGAALGGPFEWVSVGIGDLLGQLVALPFAATVATLLYFDGRIRSEGLDLQVAAAELDR